MAKTGLFVQALSGFIHWIAPQYEKPKPSLLNMMNDFREEAANNTHHRRTPEITANLGIGLFYFLQYAEDNQAITKEHGNFLFDKEWQALGKAASQQAQLHAAAEPTGRFMELLQAAVASGHAHFAGCDGDLSHMEG